MIYKTKDTVCPFCGNSSFTEMQARDLNRSTSKEVFKYLICKHCSFVFLSPVPAKMEVYYPHDYHTVPFSLEKFSEEAADENYKLEIVKKFKSHGKLLEIGPSRGSFAFLAKQAGFEVEVIEMDEKCCDFINNALKIPAVKSDDPVFALSRMATFDVIILWHVIEHLTDVKSLLNKIVDNLNPGGVLFIASPDPDSLQFRLFKHFWVHLDAPRHLNLIPMKLLTNFLSNKGLEAVCFSSGESPGGKYSEFGWCQSLRNLSRSPLFGKCLFVIGKYINNIIRFIDKKKKINSTYLVVFQKN